MGDTEKILVEDMILYTVFGVGDLAWDFIQNLFHATGLSLQATPYVFGSYQAIILLFCAIQFFRKASQYRYYR